MTDDKIMLEIRKMKDEIIASVNKILVGQIKELEKYILDMNTIKFDTIHENLKRHDKYHDDHFQNVKELDEKITKSRESITKDIEDKINNNNGNNRGNIGIFISAIAVITSIILSIIL